MRTRSFLQTSENYEYNEQALSCGTIIRKERSLCPIGNRSILSYLVFLSYNFFYFMQVRKAQECFPLMNGEEEEEEEEEHGLLRERHGGYGDEGRIRMIIIVGGH